jgi:AGZA family xanthine/uracil permease-like MFS transporter
LGIVPALAAWGMLMVESGLRAAGKSLHAVGLTPFGQSPAMHGMISLQQGFIFTSMILAAMAVALIERRFERAGQWSLAAAALSAVGVIHAYDLAPAGVANRFGLLAAPEFVAGYLMLAVLFFAVAFFAKRE